MPFQAKADTDAYGVYDLAADGPWQTLQEQLAQADADLADALANANTTYNTSVMAADVQDAKAYVAAQVAYDTGVEGAMNDYISMVAPAWAASIIAASGNDSGTTTWANAWAAYMIAAVSDGGNSQSQEDTVFQNTEDEMLDLGPGLSAQISAADKTLADQAGAAEVKQVTDDTNAVLACDAVTVPAQVTLTKGEIDNAHDEAVAEIKADKQDGETHATDEDTRAKGYSAAKLAFVQQVDPKIASDDEAERTRMASDGNQADQDVAAANKKVDTATETEVDDLVPDGKTLVDSEAKADKDYVKAQVKQAVDDANAQATATASAVAAEPDSTFTAGQTIGVPGIYIDIHGSSTDFALPVFDGNGSVSGYRYFSFTLAPLPWYLVLTGGLGFHRGRVSMDLFPATFNPEYEFDYFVPTSNAAYQKMMDYAMNALEHGMNYGFFFGRTGTGFTIDTMDEASLWPKLLPMAWQSGQLIGDNIEKWIKTQVKLPGYNTAGGLVLPWFGL